MIKVLELVKVEADCTKGVVNNPNKYEELLSLLTYQRPLKVEIIDPNGTKHRFPCSTHERSKALEEAKVVVRSIETQFGKAVFWRFDGENVYRIGHDKVVVQPGLGQIKKALGKVVDFFFEDVYED